VLETLVHDSPHAALGILHEHLPMTHEHLLHSHSALYEL
jgi:hypothetical protein